jgi:hypothetical protein
MTEMQYAKICSSPGCLSLAVLFPLSFCEDFESGCLGDCSILERSLRSGRKARFRVDFECGRGYRTLAKVGAGPLITPRAVRADLRNRFPAARATFVLNIFNLNSINRV